MQDVFKKKKKSSTFDCLLNLFSCFFLLLLLFVCNLQFRCRCTCVCVKETLWSLVIQKHLCNYEVLFFFQFSETVSFKLINMCNVEKSIMPKRLLCIRKFCIIYSNFTNEVHWIFRWNLIKLKFNDSNYCCRALFARRYRNWNNLFLLRGQKKKKAKIAIYPNNQASAGFYGNRIYCDVTFVTFG